MELWNLATEETLELLVYPKVDLLLLQVSVELNQLRQWHRRNPRLRPQDLAEHRHRLDSRRLLDSVERPLKRLPPQRPPQRLPQLPLASHRLQVLQLRVNPLRPQLHRQVSRRPLGLVDLLHRQLVEHRLHSQMIKTS